MSWWIPYRGLGSQLSTPARHANVTSALGVRFWVWALHITSGRFHGAVYILVAPQPSPPFSGCVSIASWHGTGIQLTRCITWNSIDFRLMSKRNFRGFRGRIKKTSYIHAIRCFRILTVRINEYIGSFTLVSEQHLAINEKLPVTC